MTKKMMNFQEWDEEQKKRRNQNIGLLEIKWIKF